MKCFRIVCLVYALIIQGTLAGTILLQSDLSPAASNRLVFTTISLCNRGDEPARSLTTVVSMGTNHIEGTTLTSLQELENWSEHMAIAPLPTLAGTYPVSAKTSFTDINGYPYSVVTATELLIGDSHALPPDRVTGWIDECELDRTGRLIFHLANKGDTDVDARIRLVLPDEIECRTTERGILVPAGSGKRLEFDVKNLHGRPDSTHSIFGIITWSSGFRPDCAVIAGRIVIHSANAPFASYQWPGIFIICLLALALILIHFLPGARQANASGKAIRSYAMLRGPRWPTIMIILALIAFIAAHLALPEIFTNTMAVGGDTPAHNYMASHLSHTLFQHGSIISWAPGWWCGFPLFQYYFALPYLLMALAGLLLPFNIAFKLTAITGILLTPLCAWGAGRRLRMPHPGPLLLALVATLGLFVKTHTMWGANIYSTFAGMIANSLSFPLMILFLAAAWRDTEDGVFNPWSALLFALVIASHFFTALVAVIALVIFPLLQWRTFSRTIRILAAEVALGAALMAWWLIPLILKNSFSVDFGDNWRNQLLQTMPDYTGYLVAPALIGIVVAIIRPGFKSLAIWLWMGIAGLVLYQYGYNWSPVFVNVRFWPFIFWSLLALAAGGLTAVLTESFVVRELVVIWSFLLILSGFSHTMALGALATGILLVLGWMSGKRWPGFTTILIALTIMLYIDVTPNEVRAWARWNFSGLETKPMYSSFSNLLHRVDGTPGRLANDLSAENNVLGSCRIFEAVPHLIGKPILEGGIVNSGLGSLYSYYIQSETSPNPAGFPVIVRPTTLDLTNATRHLKLCNVKHFIARNEVTRRALRAMPDQWKFIESDRGWDLFELTTHSGRYVTIPAFQPGVVDTRKFKEYGLEWIYTPSMVDQPWIFLQPGQVPPPAAGPVLDEARFRRLIISQRDATGTILEWSHLGPCLCPGSEDNPIDFPAIVESEADPLPHQAADKLRWQTLFSSAPHALDRIHTPATNFVAYSFVNIFSPDERDALILYAGDESVKIWMNGHAIAASGHTGFAAFKEIPVKLQAGRNRLLHKIEQTGGGCYFIVRLTAPSGTPFSDVVTSVEDIPPPPVVFTRQPTDVPLNPVVTETIDHDRISFHTTAIGQPHLIKMSWFSNWRVQGARQVYMVTPAFMLVYPEQADVVLIYSSTTADYLGYLVTGSGLFLLGVVFLRRRPMSGRFRRVFNRATLLKTADAIFGPPLCWLLGYTCFFFSRQDARHPDATLLRQARRILIIRPGGMGDMLLLMPVIHQLRKELPLARIDILCERRNMGVIRIAGLESCAIPYDQQIFRLAWRLLRTRYDIALDTEQFHHFSAIMALLSRARARIGFKINPARNHIYTHLIDYAPDGPECDQFARLLMPLNVREPLPDFEGLLRSATLPASPADGSSCITIYCGSSTPYKQWPLTHFAELTQRLAISSGMRVVLVGNQADSAASKYVVRACAGLSLLDLTGRQALETTAAAIRSSQLFIGGDSGLAHLAIALGIPTVILFGPSDARKWGFRDARHAVVQRSPACAPCFIFGYHKPCHSIACMADIGVEDVYEACSNLLGKVKRPG